MSGRRLLQTMSVSRSSDRFPSQKKTDRTSGMMFTHAASRSSTSADAIFPASSAEPAVISTTTSSAIAASK
jgi:hypothetical protein